MASTILSFFLLPIVLNKALYIRNFSLVITPAIFYFYMLCTALWADNLSLALVRGLGIIFLVFSFALLQIYSEQVFSQYTNRKFINLKKIENLILCYISLTFIYYIVGIYFFNYSSLGDTRGLFGIYVEGPLIRLRGFANSPNNIILILLPIFYYSYVVAQSRSKLLYIGLLTLLVLTFSGAGYAGLVLIFISILSVNIKNALVSCCTLVVALVCLIYSFYNFSPEIAHMIDVRLLRLESGSGRFILFNKVFELSLEAPFFGHGLAQVRDYLSNYKGEGLQSSHNSFLEVFFEGGIIGLSLFLLSWLVLIIKVYKSKIIFTDKVLFLSYLGCLFIISSINLMVYVELMILNLFIFIFLIDVKEQELNL